MYEVVACPNHLPRFYVLRDPENLFRHKDERGNPVGKLIRDGQGKVVKFDTEREANEYEAK